MMKLRDVLLLSGCLFFASSGSAYAYIDPGSGSILLQALLAGVAGLAVLVKLYWRRLMARFGSRDEQE